MGILGCDVNGMDRDGDTPLCHACDRGHLELVSLLLSHPDIKINAGFKNFPLHAAVRSGQIDLTQRLLNAGADVNQVI